ncbi:MAG: hypothetical protein CEE43_13640 [Promethearchaeota archaeon Loki_b32]|nr:MAG: hypothetical protein CEE43_13640 [Candidatus Lokiarchaeota archaeon Loki_b32]
MAQSFKHIEVTCPNCGEIKVIRIPEAIFIQKKFGTIKIQIPINAVCPRHQFIVFVDTKGIIRGYEKIDVQIVSLSHETESEVTRSINLRSLIRIFGVYGIFSLIHAKIFNYPSYILKEDNFEYSEDLLNVIGDNILPETYRGNKTIFLLEESDITKIKVKDKNALIMDTHQHIFQTPWTTKLKFEEEIIKRAIEIIDEEEQLKLLQQDIINFIKEVNYAISILEVVYEIYDIDLIIKVSKALSIKKISNYRLNLIKEFITQNVSRKLASKIKNRVGEFLSVI